MKHIDHKTQEMLSRKRQAHRKKQIASQTRAHERKRKMLQKDMPDGYALIQELFDCANEIRREAGYLPISHTRVLGIQLRRHGVPHIQLYIDGKPYTKAYNIEAFLCFYLNHKHQHWLPPCKRFAPLPERYKKDPNWIPISECYKRLNINPRRRVTVSAEHTPVRSFCNEKGQRVVNIEEVREYLSWRPKSWIKRHIPRAEAKKIFAERPWKRAEIEIAERRYWAPEYISL